MNEKQKNVLGYALEQCSLDPLTDGIETDVAISRKRSWSSYSLC